MDGEKVIEESSESSDLISESSDLISESSDLISESSDLISESSDLISESSDLISESSDLISESSDLISEHSDITTHLDFHKNYDVDPEGTTPELDSLDLFTENEEDCNIPANKVSIGTNTENHEEVKEDGDNINMDTINKCYMLGLIIGRALSTMSKQRREHCMYNIAHCFENGRRSSRLTKLVYKINS